MENRCNPAPEQPLLSWPCVRIDVVFTVSLVTLFTSIGEEEVYREVRYEGSDEEQDLKLLPQLKKTWTSWVDGNVYLSYRM